MPFWWILIVFPGMLLDGKVNWVSKVISNMGPIILTLVLKVTSLDEIKFSLRDFDC